MKPYLVQRITKHSEEQKRQKGVDRHFHFEYMGSSEFEWGTLPHSLRLMREHKDDFEVQEVPTDLGVSVHFVGRPEDREVADLLIEAALGLTVGLHESGRRFNGLGSVGGLDGNLGAPTHGSGLVVSEIRQGVHVLRRLRGMGTGMVPSPV
jgi:hypothetical protein